LRNKPSGGPGEGDRFDRLEWERLLLFSLKWSIRDLRPLRNVMKDMRAETEGSKSFGAFLKHGLLLLSFFVFLPLRFEGFLSFLVDSSLRLFVRNVDAVGF
jgi:hypothetical protein